MLEDRFMTIEQLHEYIRQFLEIFRMQVEELQQLNESIKIIAKDYDLTQ